MIPQVPLSQELGMVSVASLFAQWPPATMGDAILSVFVFGMIGIFLAVVGFKLFDWITPGNLGEEITNKNNMSAAILAGAVVIGISIILAAAIHG
jgi:putative membrane protein